MSIQDDIFDVQHALRRRPEKAAFERVLEHLYAVEEREERATSILNRIRDGVSAFRGLIDV